jgi:hypothetical protein
MWKASLFVSAVSLMLAAPSLSAGAEDRTASSAWSPLESPRVRVWSDRGAEPASGQVPSIRITLDGGVEYRAAGGTRAPS